MINKYLKEKQTISEGWIGGLTGFALGGPLGAIAGSMIQNRMNQAHTECKKAVNPQAYNNCLVAFHQKTIAIVRAKAGECNGDPKCKEQIDSKLQTVQSKIDEIKKAPPTQPQV